MLRWRSSTIHVLTLLAAGGACSHDWDAYDPRLGGGGAAGAGGHPASTSASASASAGGGGALPSGTHLCSKRFGGANVDEVRGVAADNAGNVLLTGEFKSNLDFGGGVFMCAGSTDGYIAKLDAACGHLWSRSFGDAAQQLGWGILSSAGDVIAIGEVAGIVDLGGGPVDTKDLAFEDLFLARYTPSGAHIWSRVLGDTSDQFGRVVASDPAGNLTVSVDIDGQVDLGCGQPLVTLGGVDIVVAKLDGAGGCVWQRQIGGTGYQHGRSIAMDDAGNIVLTGGFEGTVDFGDGIQKSAGSMDIFVTKLSAGGTTLWTHRFGGQLKDYARGVAIDKSGNVLVTGRFEGSADFGQGPVASAGVRDVFLMKLSPAGVVLWAHTFGGPLDDNARGIAVDADGNVVIAGKFEGTAAFGGAPLVGAGGEDAFVAKYTPGGAHLWSRRFGDAADQVAAGVAIAPQGDVILAGSFAGSIDFGGGPLVSAGMSDIFVARFAP